MTTRADQRSIATYDAVDPLPRSRKPSRGQLESDSERGPQAGNPAKVQGGTNVRSGCQDVYPKPARRAGVDHRGRHARPSRAPRTVPLAVLSISRRAGDG